MAIGDAWYYMYAYTVQGGPKQWCLIVNIFENPLLICAIFGSSIPKKKKNEPSFAHFGLIEIMIVGLGR